MLGDCENSPPNTEILRPKEEKDLPKGKRSSPWPGQNYNWLSTIVSVK